MKRFYQLIVAGIALVGLVTCDAKKQAVFEGPLYPYLTMDAAAKKNAQDVLGMFPEEQARWGFMDRDGNKKIEPEYHYAHPFADDRATVQFLKRSGSGMVLMLESRWGAIDRSGRMVIDAKLDHLDSFSEGLAKAVLPEKEAVRAKWPGGYINTSGKRIIAWDLSGDLYYYAGRFSEGLAYVPVYSEEDAEKEKKTDEKESGSDFASFFDRTMPPGIKLGYIDRNGDLVVPAELKAAGDFNEGLAFAMPEGTDKYGFIDASGSFIIEPQFDDAGDFAEGFSYVSINDLYGFIDKTGNYLAEPRFEKAGSFSEGFAPVRTGGKFGFIDTRGQIAIAPQFDLVGGFSDGFAAVGKETDVGYEWGFIDTSGETAITSTFNNWMAPEFEMGLALVQVTQEAAGGGAEYASGYIDSSGKWVYGPVAGPWFFPVE